MSDEQEQGTGQDAELTAMLAEAEQLSADPTPPKADPVEKPEPAKAEAEAKQPEAPKADVSPEKAAPAPEAKPDEQSEHNRVMADLRRKATDHEREVAELRRQLEESKARPHVPENPRPSARDVFASLVRANRGGYTEYDGQNESVRLAATRLITGELASNDVADVLRGALAGEYGEVSGEIADAASKALPLIQHREFTQTERTRRDSAEAAQAYQSELAEATKAYAPFADANTAEGKFLREWTDKALADLPPDARQYIARHPKVLGQLVSASHGLSVAGNAALQTELTKLKQENESMRKKLALKDSPERPSAPVSGDEITGDQELEELKRQAVEMSAKR